MKPELYRELGTMDSTMDGLPRHKGTSVNGAFARLFAGQPNPVFAFATEPVFQVFLLLQILDAVTTIQVLQNGGYETNPLVNNLMTLGAVNGLVIAKLCALAIGAVVLTYGRPRVLLIANCVYGAIICWNLMALFAA